MPGKLLSVRPPLAVYSYSFGRPHGKIAPDFAIQITLVFGSLRPHFMLRPSLDWAKPRIVRDANIKLRRLFHNVDIAAQSPSAPQHFSKCRMSYEGTILCYAQSSDAAGTLLLRKSLCVSHEGDF